MKVTPIAYSRFAGISLIEGKEDAAIRKMHGLRCTARTPGAVAPELVHDAGSQHGA